jgi:deoxycytidylate deaminase
MLLSKKQSSIIKLAARVAQQSTCTHKHGCILVKGGKILNTACNQSSYSHFANRFLKRPWYGTRHAEVNVVLGLSREITSGATIYLVRIGKGGALRDSCPCSMCADLLKFVGVRRVVYSGTDAFCEALL